MNEQPSTPKAHLLGYNVIARRQTTRDNKKQWRSLASGIVQNMEEAIKLRDEYLNEHLSCMVDIIPLYSRRMARPTRLYNRQKRNKTVTQFFA